MTDDFWNLPVEVQQERVYGLGEPRVDEPSDLWPLRFSVRIFPLEADEAGELANLLSGLSPMTRVLPKKGGKSIVLVDIDSAKTAARLKEVLVGRVAPDGMDVFVSWLPERDSMIMEIPTFVVGLAAQLRCRLYSSF